MWIHITTLEVKVYFCVCRLWTVQYYVYGLSFTVRHRPSSVMFHHLDGAHTQFEEHTTQVGPAYAALHLSSSSAAQTVWSPDCASICYAEQWLCKPENYPRLDSTTWRTEFFNVTSNYTLCCPENCSLFFFLQICQLLWQAPFLMLQLVNLPLHLLHLVHLDFGLGETRSLTELRPTLD